MITKRITSVIQITARFEDREIPILSFFFLSYFVSPSIVPSYRASSKFRSRYRTQEKIQESERIRRKSSLSRAFSVGRIPRIRENEEKTFDNDNESPPVTRFRARNDDCVSPSLFSLHGLARKRTPLSFDEMLLPSPLLVRTSMGDRERSGG